MTRVDLSSDLTDAWNALLERLMAKESTDRHPSASALATELAQAHSVPLVLFTSSGGARMHEGMLSLMQMAKTCSALSAFNGAGGFSICVMTNPTTGGVTASFASVCDLTLAEPGALIGFAGPRVIKTTIKQDLPHGFQRSEFLQEKGQLDAIVSRDEMRPTLARLIDYGMAARDYPPASPQAEGGSDGKTVSSEPQGPGAVGEPEGGSGEDGGGAPVQETPFYLKGWRSSSLSNRCSSFSQ